MSLITRCRELKNAGEGQTSAERTRTLRWLCAWQHLSDAYDEALLGVDLNHEASKRLPGLHNNRQVRVPRYGGERIGWGRHEAAARADRMEGGAIGMMDLMPEEAAVAILLKYPAVTWMDAILARFFLNSLTSVLISILLLSGVMLVTDTHASLDLPPVVTAMALAMILGLGVGTINCALIGLFPIWDIAWSIITRPLFLASGVLYTFESLPPLAQDILWYNPLVHILGLMRVGFYSTYTASYVNEIYVLGVSLGLMAMGQILLGRYHRDILNR